MTTCRIELLETVFMSAWVQSMSACTLANRCSEDSSLNSASRMSATSCILQRRPLELWETFSFFNRLSARRRAHCPSTSVEMLPSLGIIRRLEGLKAHPNPMFTNNLSKKMHQSVNFWSAFERLVSLGGTLFQKTWHFLWDNFIKRSCFRFQTASVQCPILIIDISVVIGIVLLWVKKIEQ